MTGGGAQGEANTLLPLLTKLRSDGLQGSSSSSGAFHPRLLHLPGQSRPRVVLVIVRRLPEAPRGSHPVTPSSFCK